MPARRVDKTRRRGRSIGRRLGVAALAVTLLGLAAGGGGYWWLLSSGRLAARAERMLAEMTGASVTVGAGRPDWSGGLILHDVELTVPGLTGPAGELAQVGRVELRLDRAALWRGRFEAEAVEMHGLRLQVCELVDEARFSFQRLQPAFADRPAPTIDLPRVRIIDGVLASGEVVDGAYRPLGELPFEGRLVQEADHPGRLKLSLRETGGEGRAAEGSDRLRVDGTVALDGLSAQGEVSGVGFAPRYRPLLPRAVREYWAELNPEGAFETVRFATDPEAGWRVLVEFESVALQLPLPAIEADPEPLRMTDVQGAIRFDPGRVRIVEPLIGEVEGLRYEVNGTLGGYDDAAPFRFSVRTDAFDVPESPRYIYALPEPVRKGFRMITPQGRLRVNMVVVREEAGGSIDYEGKAQVLDGRGNYYKFPYELTDCHGLVKFTRERVRIMNLTGRTAGEGTATITGTIAPPDETAAVDLTVVAVDVPFDEALRNALAPRHRPVLDMFFHEPSLDRLVERGHVMTYDRYNDLEGEASTIRRKLESLDAETADEPQAGEATIDTARGRLRRRLSEIQNALETPAFDLGGRADVVIRITRPEGEGDLTEEHTEIRLKHANVVFKHFPYPLRVFDGKLSIRSGRIDLSNVQATGPFGWDAVAEPPDAGSSYPLSSGLFSSADPGLPRRIVLGGHVNLPTAEQPDAEMRPHVEIDTPAGLPLNRTLIDALPAPQNRWLRKLNPAGDIDVDGLISADPSGEPTVNVNVTFDDVTARPAEGVTLTELAGEARLGLRGLELKKLTGRFGDARLDMTGHADWRDDKQRRMNFTANLKGMRFDQSILDISLPFVDIAPQWRQAFDRYRPRGRFDAALTYRHQGDEPPRTTLRLAPESLSVRYGDQRIDFGDTAGRITVESDRITIDRLAGQLGESKLAVDGRIDLQPTTDAKLKLRLEIPTLEARVRRLLPASLGELADRVKFDGRMKLELDPILWRADADEDEPRLLTRGRMTIADGRFDLGLPVRRFDGTLDLRAVQRGDAEAPIALEVALDAERAVVAGRTITDIEATLSRPAEPGAVMAVEKVRGQLYGGAVTARGKVDLATRRFDMRFNLAEVDLLKFQRKAEPPDDDGDAAGNGRADGGGRDDGDGDGAPDEPDERDERDERDGPRMQGRLSAAFDVQGRADALDQVQARGRLRIDRAELYDLPLSLGLLQVSHLAMPIARSFTEARIDYYLKNGRFTFERIALDSPSLRMAGEGAYDPDSGKLDLTLTSSNPNAIKLGPLTEVIDGLRDQLVTVRITGTLNEPRTKVKQLNGLTEAWRDVFGRGDADSN